MYLHVFRLQKVATSAHGQYQAKQRGYPQCNFTSKRMGRIRKALYLICEPLARIPCRCGTAERDVGSEVDGEAGEGERHLPSERGTIFLML